MARKKPGKKKSASKKQSAGKKQSRGRNRSAGRRKSAARSKPVAKRKSSVRKRAKKKSRKAAVARRPRRAAATLRLEVEVLELAVGGRVEALEHKLAALERLQQALASRRTHTSADDEEINPNLQSIANARRATEAQIAAAQTAVLAPPSAAEMMALRDAVRDAEDVIARNAAVNELVRAATALIQTLNA